MLMRNIFKIVLLIGSISLACSQYAGALYLEHGVPVVEIVVEYELEEFNQQANYHQSTTERIDRKDHTLTMVAQKDLIDKVPLPFPEPLPAPATPRCKVVET